MRRAEQRADEYPFACSLKAVLLINPEVIGCTLLPDTRLRCNAAASK